MDALESAFSFLDSELPSSSPALRPLGSGAVSVGTAPSVPVEAAAPPPSPDELAALSAAKLKALLSSRGVDFRGCVEKADFLSLALATFAPAQNASQPVPWVPSSKGGSSQSALERGLASLGNAFDVAGFDGGAASASLDHELQYRAAANALSTNYEASGNSAPAASLVGVEGFLAVAARLPFATLPLSVVPPARLRVRAPWELSAPVISEVGWAALSRAHTALSPAAAAWAAAAPGGERGSAGAGTSASTLPDPASGPAASKDSAQLARALFPFAGQTVVGVRRVWELPIRPDTSDAAVLAAVTVAARAALFDVAAPAPRALVLTQRVSVPASAWSAFLSTASVAPRTSASESSPVVIYPGRGGRVGTTGGSVVGAALSLMGSKQVYINTLTVLLGANAAHERVIFITTSRHVEVSPPTAVKTPSINKDVVGGRAAAKKDGNLFADMQSADIACVLTPQRPRPTSSYRADRRLNGAGPTPLSSKDEGTPSSIAATTESLDPFDTPASAGGIAPSQSDLDVVLTVPRLSDRTRRIAEIGANPLLPAASDCDAAVDAAGKHAPSFSDGSVLVSEATGLAQWGALRVSLSSPQLVWATTGVAAGALTTAQTAVSKDLASLGLDGAPEAPGFSVDDMEDELVASSCALAAALRGEGVLAEAAWVDALKAARDGLGAARGEAPGAPLAPLPSGATLSADNVPRFAIAPDARAIVEASWSAKRQAALFAAVLPYDVRAKADEAVSAAILTALAPAVTASKVTVETAPTLPALLSLPLAPVDEVGDADGLTRSSDDDAPLTALTAAELLAPPPGLTVTEDAQRRVYTLAHFITRRMTLAMCATAAVAEHAADVDAAARAARKLAHVGLRCGHAFYSAAAAMSSVASAPPPPPPVGSAFAALAGAPTAPPDPVRTMLKDVFSAPASESPLLGIPVREGILSPAAGTLLVTSSRVAFYSPGVGYSTKRSVQLREVVGVRASVAGGGLADAISLTFVDEAKAAAAEKKSSAAREAMRFPRAPVVTAPAAPASATVDDLFASMVFTASTAAPAVETSLHAPRNSHTITAPTTMNVADAFSDLGIFDGAGASSDVAVDAPAATTKGSPTPTVAAAAASSALHPALAALSEHDLQVFLSSGGTADTLVTLTLCQFPVPVPRDAVYALLQFARQLDARPHSRTFDFPLIGTALPPKAGRPLPRLVIPDVFEIVCAEASSKGAEIPKKPLLLRAPGEASAMASLLLPGGATVNALNGLDDLFAQAPAPSTVAAVSSGAIAAANTYSDLADIEGADSL